MLTEQELWGPVWDASKPFQGRHEFQMRAVEDTHPAMAMIGEVGPGKTTAAVVKAMKMTLLYPDNLGLVCRDDAEDLRKTVWDVWKSMYPLEEYGPKGRQMYRCVGGEDLPESLEFYNRSSVLFGSSRDIRRWGGLNLGWIFWDQMEQGQLEQFKQLFRRVRRTSIPEHHRQMWASVNKDMNYWWVKALFEEKRAFELELPAEMANDFHAIYNPLHVNKAALGDKYYDRNMALATSSEKKRLYLSEDDEMTGRVFWRMQRKLHGKKKVDFRQIRAENRRGDWLLSYDHGDEIPSSFHFHFVEEGGRWWTGGERYVADCMVATHKVELLKLAARIGFPLNKWTCQYIFDWSVKGRRGADNEKMSDSWGPDWPWENPRTKSRHAGFTAMREKIVERDEAGEPMWYVDTVECPRLWDEFANLEFDPKHPGQWEFKKVAVGDGRQDCMDHGVDDCRYGMMGYRVGKKKGPPGIVNPMDGAGTMKMHRRCAKHGFGMIWPVNDDGGRGLKSQ